MSDTIELSAKANRDLWALARGGDRAAYAALVLRFSPQMRASLRGVVGRSRHWTRARPEDIADLLQELHVLLLSRGPAFLDPSVSDSNSGIEVAFRLAAKRVARSYLRSGRRSAWAESPSADDVNELATSEEPDQALQARDRLRRAFAAAGGSRGRAIVQALYVEGRTLDEICQCWHVSRNSIYCVATRFRAHVKALEAGEGYR
jgi:DNA-directed RNA polymerase specialized sigma24 family protein